MLVHKTNFMLVHKTNFMLVHKTNFMLVQIMKEIAVLLMWTTALMAKAELTYYGRFEVTTHNVAGELYGPEGEDGQVLFIHRCINMFINIE